MTAAVVFEGDCLEVMRGLADCSVDSIVTDPPYELGFMGKSWDASGVAFRVEVWREALRVLKPGGHLLAFSGSRTYHRMAVAIEDAGFEIRDQIMWVYGSGFPKSLDVSKAIDAAAGAEREVIEERPQAGAKFRATQEEINNGGFNDPDRISYSITAPATPEAQRWQGWGTALKPAHEPIVVARKPLIGTVAANVLGHGTGALNIDGCRVGMSEQDRAAIESATWVGKNLERKAYGDWATDGTNMTMTTHQGGRWPANLIHDGSEEVVGMFPDTGPSKASQRGTGKGETGCYGVFGGSSTERGHDDAGGSAARFFYSAKASKRDRDEGLEGFRVREAQSTKWSGEGMPVRQDGTERAMPIRANIHPTVKPTDLMRYLCRLVTPPGGMVLDPFTGSGSTGKGAVLEGFRFMGIELSPEYAEIARARIRHALGPVAPEPVELRPEAPPPLAGQLKLFA